MKAKVACKIKIKMKKRPARPRWSRCSRCCCRRCCRRHCRCRCHCQNRCRWRCRRYRLNRCCWCCCRRRRCRRRFFQQKQKQKRNFIFHKKWLQLFMIGKKLPDSFFLVLPNSIWHGLKMKPWLIFYWPQQTWARAWTELSLVKQWSFFNVLPNYSLSRDLSFSSIKAWAWLSSASLWKPNFELKPWAVCFEQSTQWSSSTRVTHSSCLKYFSKPKRYILKLDPAFQIWALFSQLSTNC